MLVNLTPHPIVLRAPDGADHVVPTSGQVARTTATPGTLGTVDGIPVPVASPTTYGEVVGLPGPQDGVYYIVSAIVGAAVRGRADVLCPGTGPNDGAIRDDAGRIVAVTRLVRV